MNDKHVAEIYEKRGKMWSERMRKTQKIESREMQSFPQHHSNNVRHSFSTMGNKLDTNCVEMKQN